MGRPRKDIDTSTALAVIESEKQVQDTARLQQEEREMLIAQCFKAIGQVQTSNMFAKFATVSSLVWMKQVKENKTYRDIPGIGTWETFCDSVGMSRQKVDEDLMNLKAFGEEFMTTCQQLSVGYRDLRRLRHLSAEGVFLITDKTIEIAGEKIPLDADHKEDLQAAIERILDEKDLAIEDAQATIKAKDRVLDSKGEVIKKQEKELRKFSKEAEGRDLLPTEDAFMQRMENLRTGFDGYMLKVDPDFVMNQFEGAGEITPRMRSALISTLDYMKMQILAAHDTAVTNYGDPSMNPEVLAGYEKWSEAQGQ